VIHTWAWLSWLVGAVAALSLTRNPLYLALILLCIAIVSLALQQQPEAQPPAISPLKFSVFVILLAAAFNALISHYGTHVLFTIPGRIPLLSGAVTLEALVYGASNGLVLSGLFTAFSVLNQALPVRALVHLIPRAYYPLAVITSIAVTYVPTTMRQARQIREAQAVRGHQVRGLRDWLPLLMPLLVGGLEYAMQLAEAMTARGFASEGAPSVNLGRVNWRRVSRLGMLAGLLLLSAGWLLRLAGSDGLSLALMAGGATLIALGLWRLGKQAPRTSYRREAWHLWDTFVLLGALLLLLVLILPIPGLGQKALYYSPYPVLSVPSFAPWLGIAILGLLVPGVESLKRKAAKAR
jgi:energy-coupling factor transport system permease protein